MTTKTETILKLEAVYDATNYALRLLASLTDADGHPLIGQTVNFAIQYESNRIWGNGRPPLGSSKTDENGTALLW